MDARIILALCLCLFFDVLDIFSGLLFVVYIYRKSDRKTQRNNTEFEMKNYYIRYYNDYVSDQTLEQFIQAIATIKVLHLHTVVHKERGNEFVTIWEVDKRADYPLLDHHIAVALENKKIQKT